MVQFVFHPKIKHKELFARQYEPPLEFYLTLPFSGTVKYVSGLTLDQRWTHHFVRLANLFLDSFNSVPGENLLRRFHSGEEEMWVQQTGAGSIQPRGRAGCVGSRDGACATKLEDARTRSSPS